MRAGRRKNSKGKRAWAQKWKGTYARFRFQIWGTEATAGSRPQAAQHSAWRHAQDQVFIKDDGSSSSWKRLRSSPGTPVIMTIMTTYTCIMRSNMTNSHLRPRQNSTQLLANNAWSVIAIRFAIRKFAFEITISCFTSDSEQ